MDMNTLMVRLSESLHAKIQELSKAQGISVNQFLVAAAGKISELLTEDYLEQEAKKGKREDFERFMKKVPDIEPAA